MTHLGPKIHDWATLQEFHFRPPVALSNQKTKHEKEQTIWKNSKQTHLCEHMTSF